MGDDLFNAIRVGNMVKAYDLLPNYIDYDDEKKDLLKKLYLPLLKAATNAFVLTVPDSKLTHARALKKKFKNFQRKLKESDDEIVKITNEFGELWNIVDPASQFRWKLYSYNMPYGKDKQYFYLGSEPAKFMQKRTLEKKINKVERFPLINLKNELQYFWEYFFPNSIITDRGTLMSMAEHINDETGNYEIEFRKEGNYYYLQCRNQRPHHKLKKFENKFTVFKSPYYRVCAHRIEENNNIFVYYDAPINAFENEDEKRPVLTAYSSIKENNKPFLDKNEAFKKAIICSLTYIKKVAIFNHMTEEISMLTLDDLKKLSKHDVNVTLSKLDCFLNALVEEFNNVPDPNQKYLVRIKQGNLSLNPKEQTETSQSRRSSEKEEYKKAFELFRNFLKTEESHRNGVVYANTDKSGVITYVGHTNDFIGRSLEHNTFQEKSCKILFSGKYEDCAVVEALIRHFYSKNLLNKIKLPRKRCAITGKFEKHFPLHENEPGFKSILEATKYIVKYGDVK
jgi:hypothetical protein